MLEPNSYVTEKQLNRLRALAVLSGCSTDHFVFLAIEKFLETRFEDLIEAYSAETIQEFKNRN